MKKLPPVPLLLNLVKQEKVKKMQQQQLCTLQNAIEFRSRIEFEFHFIIFLKRLRRG
jgi:hypothetical protein